MKKFHKNLVIGVLSLTITCLILTTGPRDYEKTRDLDDSTAVSSRWAPDACLGETGYCLNGAAEDTGRTMIPKWSSLQW